MQFFHAKREMQQQERDAKVRLLQTARESIEEAVALLNGDNEPSSDQVRSYKRH